MTPERYEELVQGVAAKIREVATPYDVSHTERYARVILDDLLRKLGFILYAKNLKKSVDMDLKLD